jgi:hypothetical protein
MPQIIEVPGMGEVEFPDGMSDADMSAAIKRSMGGTASSPETQTAAPQAAPTAEEAPWYQKLGGAADDMVRLAANGATFGYADKIAGYLNGTGTEDERALTAAAGDRAGSAGTVAEIGGAIATPAGLAGRGVTLVGQGARALPGLTGLAARTGLLAAEGAGYGALTAAGNDQDLKEGAILGAAGGALGNVAGEALSAGVSKVAGAFSKKPQIPVVDDLRQAASDAYQRADDAGIFFSKSGAEKLRNNIVADLTDHGFLPANEPGAAAVLGELQKVAKGNVTLKGLDSIRKMAGNAYIPGNKSNNTLTSKIVQRIDDFVASPEADDIIAGDGQGGAEAIKEARSLWSRVRKLETVSEALQKADLRAASTGSGGNLDNATRQNLRRILEKPRGFTRDEKAALETVVRGTGPQNALRLAGKLSPSGNGLMAALGVGGAMVNPMVGVASLGGMAAKSVADGMTQKNVERLVDIIAVGGRRSDAVAAPNAVQRLTQDKRQAIARALMALGVNQTVTP